MSRRSRQPDLTHQVAAELRSRITRGELAPGVRLPSERALAAQLKVSRVTIVRALTRLRTDGLLITRHGSGTFVATTDRLLDMIAPASARGHPRANHHHDALDLRQVSTAGPLDLLQIATIAVRTRLSAALRGDGMAAADIDALTELLAERLTATGLPTQPDQLAITTGATSALSLVLDTLVAPGRPVITETPTYSEALRVISRQRRKAYGWPAGPTEWAPDLLDRLLRRRPPGLLYLQPDGHNPTGGTMPPGTRQAVVQAATAAGWTIVVDETLRPLQLAGSPPPPLATHDSRVITISSLNKTVWGGLHLGWIRAPAAVARRVRGNSGTTFPSALDQAVATELFSSPDSFDEILKRRRRLLAANLRHLEERLDCLGDADVNWDTPAAGVTLWLSLEGRSSQDVVDACARLGLLLEPSSTFAVDGRDDSHLRIPLTPTPAVLDQVTDALAQALQSSKRQ